jgi:hypothetical protein
MPKIGDWEPAEAEIATIQRACCEATRAVLDRYEFESEEIELAVLGALASCSLSDAIAARLSAILEDCDDIEEAVRREEDGSSCCVFAGAKASRPRRLRNERGRATIPAPSHSCPSHG